MVLEPLAEFLQTQLQSAFFPIEPTNLLGWVFIVGNYLFLVWSFIGNLLAGDPFQGGLPGLGGGFGGGF